MSLYHFSAQIIGRSAGRSSVAASAYRAGVAMRDNRTGQTHDFSRKSGVAYDEIMTPVDAPAWMLDREQLWNEVESVEKRKDAQVAREFNVALPVELDHGQKLALARDWTQTELVARGMVVQLDFHDLDSSNPHFHAQATMRRIEGDVFGPKVREWNSKEQLQAWRKSWATIANKHLEQAGRAERIDHRTLEAQGVERTPQPHLGPHASAVERRTGKPSRIRQDWRATTKQAMQARAQDAAEQKRKEAQARAALYSIQMQVDQAQAQIAARLDPARPARELSAEQQAVEAELRERLEQAPAVAFATQAAKQATARRDRAVNQFERIAQAQSKIRQCARQVQRDMIGWEKRHPIRTLLHRMGFKQKPLIKALQKAHDLAQTSKRVGQVAAKAQQRHAAAVVAAEQAKAQLIQVRKAAAAGFRQAGMLGLRDTLIDSIGQAAAREWEAEAPKREARRQAALAQAAEEAARIKQFELQRDLVRYRALGREIESTRQAIYLRGREPLHSRVLMSMMEEQRRLEQRHPDIAGFAEQEQRERQARVLDQIRQTQRQTPITVDAPGRRRGG